MKKEEENITSQESVDTVKSDKTYKRTCDEYLITVNKQKDKIEHLEKIISQNDKRMQAAIINSNHIITRRYKDLEIKIIKKIGTSLAEWMIVYNKFAKNHIEIKQEINQLYTLLQTLLEKSDMQIIASEEGSDIDLTLHNITQIVDIDSQKNDNKILTSLEYGVKYKDTVLVSESVIVGKFTK